MKTGMLSLRLKKLGLALIVFLTLLASILIWADHSGSLMLNGRLPVILRSLSNLMALLAAYAILLQILMIARIKWIEAVFGLDKLARWHHINGFILPFLILTHPILLVASASLVSKRDWWTSFLRIVNFVPGAWYAVIAAGLFVLLVVMAVLIVLKKLKYEAWYLTHLIMYAGVLLVFTHQFAGDDLGTAWPRLYWNAVYIFVLANVLYFRFYLPTWRTLKHKFRVDRVVKEAGDVYSIYIKGKQLDKYKVKAGQFFIFRFLDRKRWWQAHPFSLSCLPNGQYLRISVKSSGDYTSELDKVKPGTRVYIDGPHGVFKVDKASKNKFLLIGGGIGITPVRAIVEELVQKNKDAILLYASRMASATVFKDELDKMAKASNFKVQYVMSDDPQWPGEKGFIDKEKIQHLVPDLLEREVYLCGPASMMTVILKALHSLGVSKSQIHFEKFSL
ncbi:MAG: ferric reductase-like transmembrane domain-containing protein [Patescibacteria group bacterium]